MIDLNNPNTFSYLDSKNVFGSTELLLDQCSQIWKDAKSVYFPKEYSTVKNIVLSGMGGSALGAQVVYHLFKDKLSVPFYINNDYKLPNFADENTLVLLSSYSGNTEETLTSAQDAIDRKCKITAITTGGELLSIMQKNSYSFLKFEPKNNPSSQPRLGTGYSLFGIIAILSKMDLLKITDEEVKNAISSVTKTRDEIKKKAIRLASEFLDKIPVIFASEFLTGNAHVIRNQFNETSKSFSVFSVLPELNHHLIEGLKNPKNKNLAILILNSHLYSEKIKKRLDLTKDVVSKNGVPYFEYKAIGETELSQVLNVLSFGGYLTFYLAILYGQDPSLIPWVDYFKEKLA